MNEHLKIYDRIFKRIFNLSNLAIINLINGLFMTNYPPDSEVVYPNKEFINPNNEARYADIIVVINKDAYHLEAQMKSDNTIVFRAFEYGIMHAMLNREDDNEIRLPEPVIIYLTQQKNIAPKSILTVHFGTHGSFKYEVTNILFQEYDIVEINRKKLIILIPFKVLKMQYLSHQKPSKENYNELKKLLESDIIDSIKANLQVGNITDDDANQLLEMTRELYKHIFKDYEKKGALEDMRPLLNGAYELPNDKYRLKIGELETENERLKEKIAKMEAEEDKEGMKKSKADAEREMLLKRIKELEQK